MTTTASMRLRLLACIAGLALAHSATAQVMTVLPTSAAVACMAPPEAERDMPEYDPVLVRRKDGGTGTLIKDLTLKELVVSAVKLPQPALFDLNTMACPFDVRLDCLQLHPTNTVREPATSKPERRAFPRRAGRHTACAESTA